MDKNNSPINKIINFFSSIKLTIVILFLLAATSIIGTVIPQNKSPFLYFQTYGETIYNIFNALNIFDMYHSFWFQFLIILLTVNLIVCSIKRLTKTWKIIFPKKILFNAKNFHKSSTKQEFIKKGATLKIADEFLPLVKSKFKYCKIEDISNGKCIYAERGRWTRLGVYLVHFSVLLLLLGSLIGSFFGFEGYVNISVGDKSDQIVLKKTNKMHKLGFDIKCNDFKITKYKNGSIKEYISNLTIIKNKKDVLTNNITVNNPLAFDGINIYQSSYGQIPVEELTLNFESVASKMIYTKTLTIGKNLNLPENMGNFTVNYYTDSYNFRGHSLGGAFVGTLTAENKKPVEIILSTRFRNFDKMRKGDIYISVKDYKSKYYTGLQITKDPGVKIVYTGFIAMIIGFVITFFMYHQKVYIEIIKKDEDCNITIFGQSNKNTFGMQNVINKLADNLSDQLSGQLNNNEEK